MRVGLVLATALSVASLLAVSGSALGAESAFRRIVVARGLVEPVQVTAPRSEARRLYVVEQGLLGLAFDPRYATNRFIYVNYTDQNGDTRVVRYRTNGSRAIPGSAL